MGRGGKKRRVPAGQAPDLPLPAESAVLRVSFLPAEQGRHAVPSGKRGGHILCALPRRRRGRRTGVRPSAFAPPERKFPAPGSDAKLRWTRHGSCRGNSRAGEMPLPLEEGTMKGRDTPASAKMPPMTRPLPKSSMGNSRAGGDARRPVYKEKRALFRASGRGTKKKSGARRKNVARRRGERADSPVDGLILRVAKLRL